MNRFLLCRACCAAAMISLGLASVAVALPHDGFPDPSLPPVHPDPSIAYYGQDLHAVYPQGVILNDPIHRGFTNIVRTTVGPDELETFDSILKARVDVPAMGVYDVPVTLTGPVSTMVYDYTSGGTGTFDTEMISLDLTGNIGGIPVIVRESPTLSSVGVTKITAGSSYVIDSFFDVFTELSIDGGMTWGADENGPGRMDLCPEPGTAILLTLAGLATFAWLRRRRIG